MRISRCYKLTAAIFLIGIVIIADQLSKGSILNYFRENRVSHKEVLPFFNLVLAWNKGVTFGLFSKLAVPKLFLVVSTVITTILAVWLWKANKITLLVSLSLIIGGAIGNIIDRIKYGAVVDFLDFHILGYHWYVFNIADACICVGVGMLLLESL